MLDALIGRDWSQGYVHDVPYTDHFYPELAPAHLNYIAVLNGCRPRPLDRPFTYCELGCGHGQTASVLAVANPNGRFFACDFNPSHVATARRWIEAGQIGNLTVLEQGFEQLAEADIPELDFIALHGVYSWISPISRRAILGFIQRKLKPEGLVYVSYNCLPGWAVAAPLQRLMIEIAGSASGSTGDKTKAAIDFLKRLKDVGSGFTKGNAAADAFVDRAVRSTPNYLAHEYLNRSWTLFYSADVAREMAAAKLAFAGSATAVDNHPALLMSKEAQALLADQPSRERRQLVQDFLTNQRFRRDIFVKGQPSLTPADIQQEMSKLSVGLLKPTSEITYAGRSMVGTYKFDTKAARAVVESLASGPKTIGSLTAKTNGASLPPAEIHRAVHILIASGQIASFASAPESLHSDMPPTRFAVPAAYNRAVIAAAWTEHERATLASPVAGTGIRLDSVERSILGALRAGEPQQVVDTVWREAEQRGVRLSKDGKRLETRDDNLAELQRRWAGFKEAKLPLLLGLGVVQPA